VPDGEPVTVEPFHFAIIGQTQFSGKTTLIKRLSEWAVSLGYKVLIFDSKETEADYSGFGREVPVCLRETTDSFVLIGLLESMFKRRLTPYYATLSRITEGARGFGDIIARARELEARTRSSWLRDACRVLYDLLERLETETSRVEAVPELKLYDGINRMAINNFTLEAQQLIIRNSFEDALHIYKSNLILVLDEAFKFLPEKWSSAATRAVMNVVTQGAKTGLYVWLASQFLAVTDKDPLKACAVKFLGTQDHITEVKHTLDLIPEARGKFTADDIMKLKLGHWILVRKRPPFVGMVYSVPVGVPEDVGVEVARGIRSPESVRDEFLKVKVMEDDLMWKEKYLELERQYAKLKEELEILKESYREEFEKRVEEERKKRIEAENELLILKKKQETFEVFKKQAEEKAKLEEELKKLEPLKAFRQALTKFLAECSNVRVSGFEPSQVDVEHKQLVVNVHHAGDKTVKVSTDSVVGQILFCVVHYFKDREFTPKELDEKLLEHGWAIKPSTLSTKLSLLTSEGKLIKTEVGYRLPKYVKVNILGG
jgi:hypothetical protein